MPQTTPAVRFAFLIAALALTGGACNVSETFPDNRQSDSDVRDSDGSPKSTTGATGTFDSATDKWDELYEAAQQHLRQDDLDEAQRTIADLKQSGLDLTPRRADDLAAIEAQLSDRRRLRRDSHHAERIEHVKALMDHNDLASAFRTLEEVLLGDPNPDDRAEALRLKTVVEEQMAQDNGLNEAIRALATEDPDAVRDAQNRLFESPTAALPLLQTAARADNPVLVRNALAMLGKLLRPEATLPVMLSVLKRPEQEANWADAIEHIQQNGMTGAGEPLLELARSSSDASQRIVALNGLAAIHDPPRQTLVTLLPMLFQDGPQLAPALNAVRSAVVKHRQNDLLSRRGLDTALSEKQLQRLADLPRRLQQVIGGADAAAAAAARQLAVATRQIAADPIPDVRVLAFGSETDNGPAAAAIDGVWDSADPKHMWRYPVDQQGVIVLDLGRRRTVTGIRIWNFNEPAGMHRGWKEIEIFVGSTPTELATLTASGQIPLAPGAADQPDYSTTIPVSFISGRYVRLNAKSLWRKDSHAGLSEVQILGF